MSEPDYENLAFEPDMTWEDLCKCFTIHMFNGRDAWIKFGEDKYLIVDGYTKKVKYNFKYINGVPDSICIAEFKSFKAIKRVITAILESVVDN